MLRPKMFGFLFLILAAGMFLLKMLCALMEKELSIFTIGQIYGLDWIERIPWVFLQNIATTVSTTSLALIFIIMSVVSFAIDMFKKQ